MKIRVIEKPNQLKEACLLISSSYRYKKDGSISLIDRPEKYGLSELDLHERYADFIEFYQDINERLIEKMDSLEVLKSYWQLKEEKKKLGFLTEIGLYNEAKKMEDLSLDKFKKGALQVFRIDYSPDRSKDLDQLNREMDEFINSDIDLSIILDLLKDMEIEDSDKLLYLDFFSNIEDIYKEYIDFLELGIDLYKDYYPRLHPYVEASLERLKVDGKYPAKLSNSKISEWMNIEGIKGGEEYLNYYISLVQYNGLSLFISGNPSLEALAIEGILFDDFYHMKELRQASIDSHKKQILALGDESRFKIISCLSKRPYYLKELADELGLTSPTVSHHIDILFSNKMIVISNEGRKIYYSLNRKEFLKLGGLFKRIGEGGYEEE